MNDEQKRTIEAIVNIFETSSVRGRYDSVTLLKGDKGHLTYGRSQTTLGSGRLFVLINNYCQAEGAQFAGELEPFLERLRQKDTSLDTDRSLRALLREAGGDPVMKEVQDAFFDRNYFQPAMQSAANASLTLPLAQAVVYDSCIQGGWGIVRGLVMQECGPVCGELPQEKWIETYITMRKAWLNSLDPPLPSTTYRMDAFATLVAKDLWDLPLPLMVRGVEISAAAIGVDAPVRASIPDSTRPILQLKRPYITSPDVSALQKALAEQGLANSQDGIFGPFTDVLVRRFQRMKGLQDDGVVGPMTWSELGID